MWKPGKTFDLYVTVTCSETSTFDHRFREYDSDEERSICIIGIYIFICNEDPSFKVAL